MLSLIVLEIESLIHIERISKTIFDDAIFSANKTHINLLSPNKRAINDTSEYNNRSKQIEPDLRLNEGLVEKDAFQQVFNPSASLFDLCKTCNENSLEILTKYNSK